MPPPEIGAMEPRDACGSATWSTDVADCGNGAVCCRTEVLPDPGRHHTAADDRRAVGCLIGLSTRARFCRVTFSGELPGQALAACREGPAGRGTGSAEGAEGGPLRRMAVAAVVEPAFRATAARRRWLRRFLVFQLPPFFFAPAEVAGAGASLRAAALRRSRRRFTLLE